jgi:putative transposase
MLRCWVHKTANALIPCRRRPVPAAKRAIQDIHNAEAKEHATRAVAALARQHGAKYPKAVKKMGRSVPGPPGRVRGRDRVP